MAFVASKLVVSDPQILGGTPVFVGTRVPVESLVAHLKAGDTIDCFLEDFPTLSRSTVEAYLDLTAKVLTQK